MMKKRNQLIFSITITAVILATLFIPAQALSWSGVYGNNTHQAIDAAAYAILNADPAFKNVKFPTLADIQNNDWVSPYDQKGPGPDVVGQSNCSEHYYNPRLASHQAKAGGGPDATKAEYTKLVAALNSGSATAAAHAASWAAHYAADVDVPYHMQGTYRSDIMAIYTAAGGKASKSVPLPEYIYGTLGLSTTVLGHANDFKGEIEAWLEASKDHTATEDWFDPWYWDGYLNAKLSSSHIVYEGGTLIMPGSLLDIGSSTSGGVNTYSPKWSNATPSFTNAAGLQATQAASFARENAGLTQRIVDGVDGAVTATLHLADAIQAAATVWRASFTGLAPTATFSIPDKNEPQKFKLKAVVANTAGANVNNVQLKLTLTGGSMKSGETMPVIGYIAAGSAKTYTWDVEATQMGYCTAKVEVIGKYDTPDLQYAITQTTMPGVVPVSVSPSTTRWNYSMVFCLDNSGSMQGQPIKDAMAAGVKAVTAAPSGPVEMALYFFGQSGCDAPQRIVDFTIDRDRIKAAINTASARGNTPLAAAITAAGNYIKSNGRGAEASIILLTDGMETCSGDPVVAARALNPNLKLKTGIFTKPLYAASDTPIKLQVVGFNIDSTGSAAYLKQVAEAGNGNYYAAANLDELTDALTSAVKDATGGSFQFQTWWFIAAGAFLLLIIVISIARRGKRTPAPASAPITYAAATPRPTQGQIVHSVAAASYCPNCGTKIQEGAAFCTGCGKHLATPSPAFCPGCGAPATEGSTFCSKCGVSLASNGVYQNVAAGQPAAIPAAAPLPSAKKVSGAWWLLPIFLTWVGGLIAFLIVKDTDKSKATRMLWTGIGFTIFWIALGIVSMVISFINNF